MINYNGTVYETIEDLETAMSAESETTKEHLRNEFNNNVVAGSLNQKQIDFNKYMKRAAAKDIIIAEMASENMERVRGGVWTVSQLVGLTQDTELKLVLNDVETLSFELAYQKVLVLTNPLITTEIKNGWAAKLASHFYNS